MPGFSAPKFQGRHILERKMSDCDNSPSTLHPELKAREGGFRGRARFMPFQPQLPTSQHGHVSTLVCGASQEEVEKEDGHSWRQGPPPSPGKPALTKLTNPETGRGLGDGLVQTPKAQTA